MKRGAQAECAAETKKSRHQAKDRPSPPIEVVPHHSRVKLIAVDETTRGSPLVNTRVRSRWESEWFEASIIDFKYWEAGKYPGEGFSKAAYFFELKYDTGEFEYVEANKLWDSFEKIPVEVHDTGTGASAGAEDGLAEADAKAADAEDGLAEADAKAAGAEDGLAEADAKAADAEDGLAEADAKAAEDCTTEAEAKAAGVEDGPAKATGELSDDEYEGPVASLLWGL